MSDSDAHLKARLAGPLEEVLERGAEPAGEHPSTETLIAYHGGALPEVEQERIQDHLVACRACLDALLELDSFVQPQPEGAPGVEDLEAAAVWRGLRSRLRRPAPSPWPSRPWRPLGATAALAATLLVALLGVSFWSLEQRRTVAALRKSVAELSGPQPNAAIVDLYPAGTGEREAGAPRAVEVPAEAAYLTLVLNLREPGSFPGYEAELLDAEGRQLWTGGGLRASRFGTLRIGLPGGFLGPGEHRLRLYGDDGEERHWIETYTFRVP